MATSRYKILFAEDDQLDQMAFKQFVKKEDMPYDCTVVGSVAAAKEVLNKEKFDIIISDYSLGDGSALEILELARDTPVVCVTGAGDEEVAVRVWQAGAYDYLVKDIDRNYLKSVPITVDNAIKHRRTEDKLRLLSEAIRSTDESVYITDMDDKIIFVNRAFCETYGYNEDEIIGQDSSILWIGKEQTQSTRSVFQTRAIGSTWEVGFYHKRKDGTIFPVSLSRSIIKDSVGRDAAVVGIGRDISERILIEDELRTANFKLEKQKQLRNEVAIKVTEAIRSLLANGMVDETKSLVNNYLDILQIDAGRMKLSRREFGLGVVVAGTVGAMSPQASEKHVVLKADPVDANLIVNADSERIEQVLRSLLSRAIKTAPAGSQVAVRVQDMKDEIVVEVHDEGPVIDAAEIRTMLNCFGCVREQFHKQQDGQLLGPAIAKELVELHGGRMWVKSGQERGNTFCFALPKSGHCAAVAAAADSGATATPIYDIGQS
jgi:PAS domain S-box-containing protein